MPYHSPHSFYLGGTVAKYAGENLHKRLVADDAYNSNSYPEALKNAFLGTDADMCASTSRSFQGRGLSETYYVSFTPTDPNFQRDPSGCTAVAALVTNDGRLFVVGFLYASLRQMPSCAHFQANAGDSRSVISIKGEVKPLSFDHKPQNDCEFNCNSFEFHPLMSLRKIKAEKSRIVAAGGYVEFGRVNGP